MLWICKFSYRWPKTKKKLHRSGSFFFSTHHTHSHGFESTNTFVRFLKIKMKKGISSSKTSLNTQHIYKIYPQTHREWEWTRKRWGEKLSLKFILPAKLCSFFEAYFQFNMYTNTFCNSGARTHKRTFVQSISHSHRKTWTTQIIISFQLVAKKQPSHSCLSVLEMNAVALLDGCVTTVQIFGFFLPAYR